MLILFALFWALTAALCCAYHYQHESVVMLRTRQRVAQYPSTFGTLLLKSTNEALIALSASIGVIGK